MLRVELSLRYARGIGGGFSGRRRRVDEVGREARGGHVPLLPDWRRLCWLGV